MSGDLNVRLESAIREQLRNEKRATARGEKARGRHHRKEALKFWRIWLGLLGTPREQERAIRECREAGI